MLRTTIPLAGQFNCWTGTFDLPDLLREICERGITGELRLESGGSQRRLALRDGEIVFASSSSPDDRLGEYLLRKYAIALTDLQRFSPGVRPGLRLGQLLVENGLLDDAGLRRAVSGQLRSIVLGLFRWTEASYEFQRKATRQEAITLDVPTARLIVDGIREIDSWRRLSRGIGSLDAAYRRVVGKEEFFRSADLDTESLEILAMLARPKSVPEICRLTVLPDIEVCRRLWDFRALGWVEVPGQNRSGEAAAIDSDLEALGLILGEESRE